MKPGRSRLSQREAVLAAAFPFLALSLLNDFYRPWLLAQGTGAYWLGDVAQFLLAPLAGWYFFLRPAGIGLSGFGMGPVWRRHAARPEWGAMLFAVGLIIASYWPVKEVAVHGLWTYGGKFNLGDVFPVGALANLAVALWMAASAALVEEAVWRGLGWRYLSEVLPQRGRRLSYVLITSAAFAIAHSEQGLPGVVIAFWFGILAASFYTSMGTLWPVVCSHFVIDMLHFGPWR